MAAHIRCRMYGHTFESERCIYCEQNKMSLIEIIFHYRHLVLHHSKQDANIFLQSTCSPELRELVASSVNEQGKFVKADGKLFTDFVSRKNATNSK